MKEDIIYACEEHIEMAIDDFVNNIEKAPEIMKIENEKCSYCSANAKYELKE